MTVYEMAKKYYPRLWDKTRLATLMEANKLTVAEYADITGETYVTDDDTEA